MNNLISYLQGGDLRSIANADKVVSLIKTQADFDRLFQFLFSKDRLIVMRTADAIEKITLNNPGFLSNNTKDIINFLKTAVDKELKWHLALIASRLDLTIDELDIIWNELTNWAKDNKESKIVRVNSIQSLFDLKNDNKELEKDLELTIQEIETENIPSMNARLRKLKKRTRYISILRGINVGGKRKIIMTDLKALYEKLGFFNIITYIQSGNVIFDSKEDQGEIVQKIEQSISRSFGFNIPVIIRTLQEIEYIVVHNPFLKEQDVDIENLHLTFLSKIPSLEKLEQIKGIDILPEKFKIIKNNVFIYCSGKYSNSKLTNKFFESKLNISATTRNWKTVSRLYKMIK